MEQDSLASKLVPRKVSNRSCYLQSMPRRKKSGAWHILRERTSKLIHKNWISLEKSKFGKEQTSHVSVRTAEIVSWVQSFLKNIQKNKNKEPKSCVMKILEYRSPVQGRRVKHDFATNQENEAELLCRRFIRTWQERSSGLTQPALVLRKGHLSDDLITP